MNRLMSVLKRRTIAWAGQMTQVAKTLAPHHIRPYIHSHVEEKAEGSFIIRTSVNLKEAPLEKYGSADARAQEYGSGLRAEHGTKAKYPIYADKSASGYLVFMGTNDFAGKLIVTESVQHPGIKAYNQGRGYMRLAGRVLIQRAIQKELSTDVKQAILGDLRQSFEGKSK